MLYPTTPSYFIVRDHRPAQVRSSSLFALIPRLVSGHAIQIKDLDGDEDDGLDECLFFSVPFQWDSCDEWNITRYMCCGLPRQQLVHDS